MKVLGIIPARYDSTRFPGKPLVEIRGKSMIRRVFEQAQKARMLTDLMVATDDERIFDHVLSFGGKAMLTSPLHQSGSERCAEVLSRSVEKWDLVVNIQGDEPFVSPNQIDTLVSAMCSHQDWNIGTLAVPMKNLESVFNPNHIKVVFEKSGLALYFSRAPVPFIRDLDRDQWIQKNAHHKHVGMYIYKGSILKELATLQRSSLEDSEKLEQLRWMEEGYRIGVVITQTETPSIDTPEDLQYVLSRIDQGDWV